MDRLLLAIAYVPGPSGITEGNKSSEPDGRSEKLLLPSVGAPELAPLSEKMTFAPVTLPVVLIVHSKVSDVSMSPSGTENANESMSTALPFKVWKKWPLTVLSPGANANTFAEGRNWPRSPDALSEYVTGVAKAA